MGKTLADCLKARYVLCLLVFVGFMNIYLLRLNLNIAIVGMVNRTATAALQNTSSTSNIQISPCLNFSVPVKENSNEEISVDLEVGEFIWDEVTQSFILSSFFWGYLLSQAPGGRVAELYGLKKVFGGAIIFCGILSLLVPYAAHGHWTLLLIIRALQGISLGVTYPSINAAVGKWIPLHERSRFLSISCQGASAGIVLGLPLCGHIQSLFGWESVFYLSGILALTWGLAWNYLVFDSPSQHPRISDEERRYIESHLKESNQPGPTPSIPWGSVVRSLQFWLGTLATIGNDWGFFTIITLSPKYLSENLGFTLTQTALLTSIPFLLQWIFATFYSMLCDSMIQKKTPVIRIRKMSIIIAEFVPGISCLVIAFSGCNSLVAVIALMVAITGIGAFTCGHYQIPLDIAPNFGGTLTGVIYTISALIGCISTQLPGTILSIWGNAAGWKIIFTISSAMYILFNLPYMILGKTDVEPWNEIPVKANHEEEMKPMKVDRNDEKSNEV